MTVEEYEAEILAHRYLYYVLAQPALCDSAYDKLEREARAVCPENSVVHRVGSSLPSSYTPEIVALALRKIGQGT